MLHKTEHGIAMITVVLGMAAIALMGAMAFRIAGTENRQSQAQRRDDTVVAASEAMLERYATKLTIDPVYYLNWVDNAEPPRECDQVGHPLRGTVRNPGEPWIDDCNVWIYGAAADFFFHPLLNGEDAAPNDDVGALIHVTPPDGAQSLKIEVVGKQSGRVYAHAIQAEIRPEAISEYAWMVENTLNFGPAAVINGKIYVGRDLGFRPGPPLGIVHADAFAYNRIGGYGGYVAPAKGNPGVTLYDNTGRPGYEDVTVPFPDPVDFDLFWGDLAVMKDSACGGGGLCLSPTEPAGAGLGWPSPGTPTAYRIDPLPGPGESGRLDVWVSYATNTTPCVNAEEWWWLNSQTAAAAWQHLGTFDIPLNGAVWADQHVVIGHNAETPVTVEGAVTIYAGQPGSSSRNIIIGSDVLLDGIPAGDKPASGTHVLGLVASDDVVINPYAAGLDEKLNIYASMLIQGRNSSVDGHLFVARDCGSNSSGGDPYVTDNVTGNTPELTTWGSIAMRRTGSVSGHFAPRNYGFDSRLETLRPPMFPILGDAWEYANWRETNLPCWADDGATC